MRLILASTSPYRRQLLARLGIPFEQVAPGFEELVSGSMSPQQLVRRNTLGKGRSVCSSFPQAAIIASDQLAVCDGRVLGKPGSEDVACDQLRLASGRCVEFLTGLTLISPEEELFDIISCQVHFRQLTDREIKAYIHTEGPLDCCGSFKSEGLGITLLERIVGDDPTALTGLPLIRLSQWLRDADILKSG